MMKKIKKPKNQAMICKTVGYNLVNSSDKLMDLSVK
jgi:hypothetical protein